MSHTALRLVPRLAPRLSTPSRLYLALNARDMSSHAKKQEPQILETETYDTPAKWLKLERIKYRDQEGKEVGLELPD